jgi:hypothetical protein
VSTLTRRVELLEAALGFGTCALCGWPGPTRWAVNGNAPGGRSPREAICGPKSPVGYCYHQARGGLCRRLRRPLRLAVEAATARSRRGPHRPSVSVVPDRLRAVYAITRAVGATYALPAPLSPGVGSKPYGASSTATGSS